MPIIGHASKMAFGWAVGESDDTALALQAWKRAKRTFQGLNISCVGMIMHHDRDSVYTGYEWTSQLLLKDKARLSYALRGARQPQVAHNPAMESFNGRFKGENHSLLLESQDLDELVEVVERRMTYYNTSNSNYDRLMGQHPCFSSLNACPVGHPGHFKLTFGAQTPR